MKRLLIAVIGVVVGVMLPLGGGCSSCPEVEPSGSYRIVGERTDWVPGSGRIEVDANTVVISYATTDGSTWEVEHRRVEHSY